MLFDKCQCFQNNLTRVILASWLMPDWSGVSTGFQSGCESQSGTDDLQGVQNSTAGIVSDLVQTHILARSLRQSDALQMAILHNSIQFNVKLLKCTRVVCRKGQIWGKKTTKQTWTGVFSVSRLPLSGTLYLLVFDCHTTLAFQRHIR